MKTPLLPTLCVLLAAHTLALPSLFAQGGPPAHAGQGRQMHWAVSEGLDLSSLESILAMPDAQLEQMQRAIAKVRAMSPEQREAMRRRLAELRKLPPDQLAQVRQGWGWASEQDRLDWPVLMHAKPEDERARIQSEIQALPPEQRPLHKHKLLEEWRAARPQTGAQSPGAAQPPAPAGDSPAPAN